jgi:hypothetical protein
MRKKLLKSIVDMIMSGEFEQAPIDINKLYLLHTSVRKEYQAPRDISGFNWGGQRTWEMDAGMDESF